MNLFRPIIAFLLISLASSQAMAAGEETTDPAPSGNEQTHVTVGETGASAGPGRDYDDGTGGSTTTSHDFSDWTPSSEENTTIEYSGSSDAPDASDADGQ